MLKWNVSLFNKNRNVYCCWIVSDSPHVNAEWIASCRRSDYATVLRDTVFNIYRNLYPFGYVSVYFFSSQVLKLSMSSFPCWSFSSCLSWLLSCSFVWRSKFQLFHLSHITVLCNDFKQLLDKVFVISGIIKVEVSVISRAEGRGW